MSDEKNNKKGQIINSSVLVQTRGGNIIEFNKLYQGVSYRGESVLAVPLYISDGRKYFVERNNVDKKFTLHSHDYYEAEFIIEGTGIEQINGLDYSIGKGYISLLRPADYHAYRNASLRVFSLKFDSNTISRYVINQLYSNLQTSITYFQGEEYDFVYSLLSQIEKYSEESGTHSETFVIRCIELLLVKIINNSLDCMPTALPMSPYDHGNSPESDLDTSEEAENQDRESVMDARYQRVLAYIHANFRSDIQLREIADFAHLSPNYCSSFFNKRTGMSLKTYINKLRVDYAQELISRTDMSMKEICFESGFHSTEHFTRVFKKIHHITPASLRVKLSDTQKQ